MNSTIFNAALLTGWLLIVGGLAMLSVPLALVVGGIVLMSVTILLARWAGVRAATATDKANQARDHVPE